MEQYKGWSNFPTWDIKVWIDNNDGLCRRYTRAAKNIGEPGALALMLKEEFKHGRPDAWGPYGELMAWALELVNWHEIAESILKKVHGED